MKQRIFIYGTLKRGGSNADYMADETFIAEALTEPRYHLVDCGGYPGMFPVGENGVSIRGEIYEVDASGRTRLDELEDVAGGEYALLEVALLEPTGERDVFTYIYLRDPEGMRDAGTDWPVA